MKGLRVITTYNCNIMCGCCRYKCGPYKKGTMDANDFKNTVLKGVTEGYDDYIVIEGGEPFLYTGMLFKYLKKISSVKTPKYIVTNGFWGRIDPYISTLSDLKKSGTEGIIIEYDYFHSLFIEMKTIKGAISKAVMSGLKPSVRAFFTTSGIREEADIKTFEIIKSLRKDFKDIDFIFEESDRDKYIPLSERVTSKKEKIILYDYKIPFSS